MPSGSFCIANGHWKTHPWPEIETRHVGLGQDAGPDRLSPIFRDRDDFASSGELGERIQAALADSAALVVICSPAAARSPWVNQEILSFKRHGDARECFPKALRFALDADGELGDTPVELIAADLRPGRDGRALARLRLLAGLLGVDLERAAQLLAGGDRAGARASAAQARTALAPLQSAEPDDRAVLLATINAEIGFGHLQPVPAEARVGWQRAVSLARGSASGRQDPRLLAMEVEALLALGRSAEAAPLIEGLRVSGYRDIALLAVLARAGIAYAVHEPVRRRLAVAAPATALR